MRDGKNIENLSWRISYRGPLLIHVSKKPESPEAAMIIGVVDLVDCLPPDKPLKNQWAFPDHYHWVLQNPRQFKTWIPARGQLSIWEYPLDPTDIERLL
jgi:hypothetical protein